MDPLLTAMKRWLTLKEAASYSAIGKQRLIAMAKDRKIKGFQDVDSRRQDWIFDRLSLDAYREGQYIMGESPREKALAIMSGIRL